MTILKIHGDRVDAVAELKAVSNPGGAYWPFVRFVLTRQILISLKFLRALNNYKEARSFELYWDSERFGNVKVYFATTQDAAEGRDLDILVSLEDLPELRGYLRVYVYGGNLEAVFCDSESGLPVMTANLGSIEELTEALNG